MKGRYLSIEGKIYQDSQQSFHIQTDALYHSGLSFLHLLSCITYQQGGSIFLACNPMSLKAELHKPHFKRKGNKIQLCKSPPPPNTFNTEIVNGNNLYNDYQDKQSSSETSMAQSVDINSLDTTLQWFSKVNIIVLKAQSSFKSNAFSL